MLMAWPASPKPATRSWGAPTSPTRSSSERTRSPADSIPNLPIDLLWDDPTVAGHLNRLASFSRSDPDRPAGYRQLRQRPPAIPRCRVWTDGLIAVLDAAGSRARIGVRDDGVGTSSMLLAASHPQRVRSLILCSPYACFLEPNRPALRICASRTCRQPRGLRAQRRDGRGHGVAGAELGEGREKAALVGPLRTPRDRTGQLRHAFSQFAAPTFGPCSKHPGADAGVATTRRPPCAQRPCEDIVPRIPDARLASSRGRQRLVRWRRRRCARRGRPSSPGNAALHRRIACCRPSCSQTLSGRPSAPRTG